MDTAATTLTAIVLSLRDSHNPPGFKVRKTTHKYKALRVLPIKEKLNFHSKRTSREIKVIIF